jgi:arabinofuranan 3-O-arabinosyltransferase
MPSQPSPFAALPCYRGPGATIDGKEAPVRLGGTIHDLLAGQPLVIASCDRKPITLDPGDHELLMSGVLQPSVVSLRSAGARPATDASTSLTPPTLHVATTISGYRIAVSGATTPFYLLIGQNVAPGWHASVGSTSLGAPLVLDGYSAGWRVDRSGTYTITVTYGPQTRQNAAFAVSALALPLVLVIGAIGWRRRRRRVR